MPTALSARKRPRRWAVLLATTLIPAGCTVGPNYHRPEVQVSERFSHWPIGGRQ
jgi:hypothetical protein